MLSRVGAAEAALYRDDPGDLGEPGGRGEDRGLFERLKKAAQEAIPRGALILGVLAVVNAGSGFLARKVVGHVFGASPETDALWNALKLTQGPVDILITGGIIGPFLPLFLGLKGEAEATARAFARTILTAALLVMAAAIVLEIIFAPQIAPIFAPGFQGSQRDLYVSLIRVVSIGQLAITASLVLGEVLIAERRFLSYGLAEFALNCGTAVGALLLGGVFGIYGAAIGFVAGSFGHLGVRLVGVYRTTFRPRLELALRTKGVGEFAVLMLPKMASAVLLFVLMEYINSIASTLAPGSTTSVTYAQDFQSTAESMIGLSFALAAFSSLSATAAAGDKRAFKRVFRTTALTIGVLSTLAAIALAVLAGFISGFFKGGAFDQTDASRMTMVLIIFAISVPFECMVEILARAIYATHNTAEPLAAVACGFVAGMATTMLLSGPIGLAALPLGYVAFRGVQMVALAIFLRPRMARIGGASRWSRALVRDRWGGVRGSHRQPIPTGQLALAAVLLVTLAGGTAFLATQALSRASIIGGPVTTPWARVNGTRPPLVAQATPSASDQPVSTGTSDPSASPTVPPGPYSMDLYQPGDFVSEILDTWCVPAAMQTSMNMMSLTPDTTRDTQAKLFDLAVSVAGESYGGADPEGWAEGLTQLGYGNYKVGAKPKLVDSIHTVVKQIAITQRPAGIIVWKGWHSWVVSGFTATADPNLTDNFTVLSVRIEDVWYPRNSSLWPASRPPDSNVPVSKLSTDYVPWVEAKYFAGRDGEYVFVIPY
jgi:putative peptidoglycan lipid II flippase